MKIAGVITEYNPFHNGHKYQLSEIKKRTGADFVVVAMSGNFVQRGTPAIMDKFERTKAALLNGADLVLEIPTIWATASAEYFGRAGVSLLNKTNSIDYLCFGAELNSLETLQDISSILYNEPEDYKNRLQNALREGLSYPAARSAALGEEYGNIVNRPNNILGIEYLKALLEIGNSKMEPVLIQRIGKDYNSNEVGINYSSATALRDLMLQKPIPSGKLFSNIPDNTIELLSTYQHVLGFVSENEISHMLGYKLLSESSLGFIEYADVSSDLSNKICNNIGNYRDFTSFADSLKSKDITRTRINRALLHILLNIHNEDYDYCNIENMNPYIHVLGFKKGSAVLLNHIKKEASAPLITKVADACDILNKEAYSFFERDLFATELYNQILRSHQKGLPKNDFNHGIVIV